MLRTLILSLMLTMVANLHADGFRVGLANVFFMAALMENNLEKPLFGKLKFPPSRMQEVEADGMNLEYLGRYFRYLDCDVLVICEAPNDPDQIKLFVDRFLGGEFEVVHNSPVVKNRKYYYNQQIAVLVKKSKFNIRRYEALSDKDVTESNRRYAFPSKRVVNFDGENLSVYWSRFPIEFDLSLKSDPSHWYKFIATYPKSKHSKGKKSAIKARRQNFVQQTMVRERVEAVSKQFEDIFVLGDMNDSIGLDPVEAGLNTDSMRALLKENDPILFNSISFKPGEGTYIYKGKPGVIDYILTSHGLKSGKGRIKNKVFEHFHFFKTMIRNVKRPRPDRMQHRELFLSDHAPVTMDVEH